MSLYGKYKSFARHWTIKDEEARCCGCEFVTVFAHYHYFVELKDPGKSWKILK